MIIVNADDFGMSPEVDRAILQAHREGIVSSTTVMANCATDLRALKGLGVGLHCNVTHGRPLTKVPSLVNERGEFWSALELLRRHAQIDPDDLRRELEAQRDRFESLYGSPPDHLDVHQYSLCFFPEGLQAVCAVAAGLPTRNFHTFMNAAELERLRERIMAAHDLQLPALSPVRLESHPKTTDHWEHRLTRRATPAEVLGWLAPYEGSVELMCHPGAGEVELLTAPELRRLKGRTFADL